MKDQKNIERLFQEKFKDFEATPPQGSWDAIASRLNEKKKKKRVVPFWFQLSSIAASLVIIGTLIWNFQSEENTTPFNNSNETIVGVDNKTNSSIGNPETKLKNKLFSKLAHEFKTPLTSIKLASNVLLENKEINENTKLKKYSEIILQQSEKLTSHIERLLDLIRSDKTFKLKKERIDLIDLINDLNSETIQKTPSSDLEISFDHPDKPVFIYTDRYHFYNVMQNIYDNAIKYNDKDHKQIFISLVNNPGEILLSVKDNGIGIKSEYLNNIFNKFFRVQKGNIHSVKGFGLGLYYVKNIVDLHGWKVFAESKENEFTTFKIKIKTHENRDQ